MEENIPVATLADAAVRLALPVRYAPSEVVRLAPGEPVAGPAVPCRHAGSVDVFLEALEAAPRGAILVIDNEARRDEACIGDLAAAEMRLAGVAAVVVWGLHRDTVELRDLGLPVWSLGALPFGPRAARPAPQDRLERARVGDVWVTAEDVVAADDGVIFLEAASFEAVRDAALAILAAERRQAGAIAAGQSLRDQLRFRDFLVRRRTDPTYDLRRHLREGGGAIET